MDNEITINGVTYIRKEMPDNQKYVFKNGCQYFTFYSCCPDVRLRELHENFPKLTRSLSVKRVIVERCVWKST